MPTRKYKTDKNQLLAEGQMIVSSTDDAKFQHKVELVKLPPYSPDLNPIEQCWRIARREVTHNTYFPDVGMLERTLDNYFSAYRQPNDKFSSLCSYKHKK